MENEMEKRIAHEAAYFSFIASVEKTAYGWFLHGPEVPDYGNANRALRLRDDGRGPEAVAREVRAVYRSRGQRPIADIDPEAERQGIGAALRRLGITPVIGKTLLMRYPHAQPPLPPKPGVTVEVIPNDTETEGVRLWVETVLSEDEETRSNPMLRIVTEHEARSPGCRLYLASLDGRPAAACDLFTADGWGRIDSVVTVPEFRRRGAAAALVCRAVADSLTLGNTETYLYTEAGGAGEQVYSRLGFHTQAINPLCRHAG